MIYIIILGSIMAFYPP